MFKQSLAAATIALFCAFPAFADDAKMNRTLSLTGHGEVRAAPDLASLSMGVTINAETAEKALAENSKAMIKLMDALKAAGIPDKDIQTSNFMINPRYDYRNDGSQPVANGFDVSNQVTVTLRNVADTGKLLDAVVAAGANQINGVSFGIDDPQAAMDEARKKAIAEAKRKAELYAVASGVTLGNIVSIAEGGAYDPRPVFTAKREAAADAGPPPPVAPGEQIIAADVTVVWEIK
jgi:uncharacterized protein